MTGIPAPAPMPTAVTAIVPRMPTIQISYASGDAANLLRGTDVLAVIGFGHSASLPDDIRAVRVALEPVAAAPFEVWRGSGIVTTGRESDLRWSSDGRHTFFAMDIDEAVHGGIEGAAEHAYRCLGAYVAGSSTPHLLRIWNYLDAINAGDDDDERYRRFCAGRARGMANAIGASHPAATAIGRHDGVRTLQVYGLAAAVPGQSLENPRQISAWQYPRQYGPSAPIFARAMLAGDHLLISGTAAVVGHASAHAFDIDAQIAETLANLDSVTGQVARTSRATIARCLKAYVRDVAHAQKVVAAIANSLPTATSMLVLAGDICRRELLVEIDGVQSLGA